jgi:hypothetical protein
MKLSTTSHLQLFLVALLAVPFAMAFAPSASTTTTSHSALFMTDNLFRAARSAGANDNVVELMRPLGLILKQDEETGNVYVDKIAPKGNAARTGKVSVYKEACHCKWQGKACSDLV